MNSGTQGDLIVIWGLIISCGCDILYLHLEVSMQVGEKRTGFVVDSPLGTGDSLPGFFDGKMGVGIERSQFSP